MKLEDIKDHLYTLEQLEEKLFLIKNNYTSAFGSLLLEIKEIHERIDNLEKSLENNMKGR